MTDKDWIVPQADRVVTPKFYPAGHNLVKPLQGVVLHYTASGFNSALQSLTANDKSGSAHFLVGRKGLVKQLASLTSRTWHAEAPHNGSKFMGNPRVNGITIGIEIENWGWLTPKDLTAKSDTWITWSGKVIPNDQVVHAKATEVNGYPYPNRVPIGGPYAWHKFTDVQVAAVEALLVQLAAAGVPMNLSTHEHCDPGRKFDTGPAYPFSEHLKAAGRVDVRHRRDG